MVRVRQRDRAAQAGFSMAAVMLVILICIMGSMALAMRGSSGLLASRLQSQSREARDVAEAGIVQVVSELNNPPNRRMLVSGLPLSSWGTTPDARQQNPCRQLPTATPTSSQARALAGNSTQNLVSGNSSRRFILKSVRYSNSNRTRWIESRYDSAGSLSTSNSSPAFDNSTNQLINLQTASSGQPDNLGYIQLEVEGEVIRGGTQAARATVTREYQVVPKCCGLSFNGPGNIYGNDRTICTSGSDNTGKLGVVTGFNGGGVTKASGGAGDILGPDGNPLQAILCITSTATCGAGVSSISTSGGNTVPVTPIAINIDPPPTYPGTTSNKGSISKVNTYMRVNSTDTAIELCDISGSTLSGCSTANYCEKVTSTVANYHCRMSDIDTGTKVLTIDSTGGRIALYFNDSPGTVATGGTGGIQHVRCGSFAGATTACATAAPASQFDRVSFYGNLASNVFDLQGTPGVLSTFVYFRQGQVNIGGNAEIVGSLWSNNLELNGSFEIAAPPTGCVTGGGAFCTLIGGGGAPSEVLFDWVARSTAQGKLY
ncbi:hypothetical protein [Synechococcus sp. CS-1328]|uniref:hypothetical protein n=1 Tax=Synechococcus sp. CS-1328 TaxID=2847976 RepID=UPI00223BE90F|nr:hypothetical protein [Synechococcus sp. CS-1328]MCT0224852.1 hypothetical protein [Synechococcus sp. CS-1328]